MGFETKNLLGLLMIVAGFFGALFTTLYDVITQDYHPPGTKTFAVMGAGIAMFFIGLILVLNKLKTE